MGIGRALGTDVFPGGEKEMLDRIEITAFAIDTSTTPPSVTTQFRIKKISSTSTGAGTGLAITNAISSTNFGATVLSQTVAAITAEPVSAWTSSDSIFTAAPTDEQGASGSSLFVSHSANATTVSTPSENVPP